jgi:xanthine dehydrogenase accessory factor
MIDDLSKPSGKQITEAVQRVIENGSTAVLITLIEAKANVGAKLLVAEAGTIAGSLGDAGLDDAAAKFAGDFLNTREEVRSFKVQNLGPGLGEWTDAQVLCERIQPEPRMVICGAGHVGASLARLASLTGYRVTLIDDRAEFLTRALFPEETIELIIAATWHDAVRDAIGNGRGVSVAVVTRGHNEDEECLRAVTSTQADYVGLIGSKRRTNIVLDRLRQAGADEARLRNVHAPVGLDIGAVTPEEVALAIMAEIVAARRGGKGTSLSAWRRQ